MSSFSTLHPNLHQLLNGTAETKEEKAVVEAITQYLGSPGKTPTPKSSSKNSRVGINSRQDMVRGKNRSKGSFQRGNGTSKIIGNRSQNSSSTVRSRPSRPLTSSYYNPNDVLVAKAHRHPDLQSYQAAVKSARRSVTKGIGVNQSARWHGNAFHEHEGVRSGKSPGRFIRTYGAEFIGEVYVPAGTGTTYHGLVEGDRLPPGMVALAPDALGGRLALLAHEFEQHKLISARVTYAPSVPTTTPGAIAFWFQNEIGEPNTTTGRDLIAHAATHPSFVQTPVWQSASISLDPSDAIHRFFDEDDGDFRLQVQGIVQIIAASTLEIAAGEEPTLGNLYFEYEFEFFAPALDFVIEDVSEMVCTVTSALNDVWTENEAIYALYSGSGATDINIAVTSPTVTAATITDFLFYGTIIKVPIGDTWPDVKTARNGDGFPLATGQGVWIRFVATDVSGTATVRAFFFADLASAGGKLDPQADGSQAPGQLLADADVVFPGTVTMNIEGRAWRLGASIPGA